MFDVFILLLLLAILPTPTLGARTAESC